MQNKRKIKLMMLICNLNSKNNPPLYFFQPDADGLSCVDGRPFYKLLHVPFIVDCNLSRIRNTH